MIASCTNRLLGAAAVLVIAFFALTSASLAGGLPDELAKAEIPCVHQVEKGETLASIAKKYLGDGGRWKELAALNPHIANPNKIVPGMTIDLPCPQKTAAEAAVPVAPVAAVPAMPAQPVLKATEPSRVFHITERQYSFITPKQYPAVGRIAGEADDRAYFGQMDEVYLDIGEEDEIELRKGDRFTIYRDSEVVEDTKTGLILGYLNRMVGDLEIVRVEKQSSVARIINSYADIHPTDKLRAYIPLQLDIEMKENARKLESMIVGSSDETFDLTDRRSFFLNKGSADGVEVGNILTVYHEGRMAKNPKRAALIRLPRELVGKAIAFRTEEHTSTAWITDCTSHLQVGDFALLE